MRKLHDEFDFENDDHFEPMMTFPRESAIETQNLKFQKEIKFLIDGGLNVIIHGFGSKWDFLRSFQ